MTQYACPWCPHIYEEWEPIFTHIRIRHPVEAEMWLRRKEKEEEGVKRAEKGGEDEG